MPNQRIEQWLIKPNYQLWSASAAQKTISAWARSPINILWIATFIAFAGQLVLARTARAQSAQPAFVLQATLPMNDLTNALAVGDLNGDGSLDLVVGNTGQNYLYFNDGFGNFTLNAAASTAFGGNEQTVDLAVGDVNNDGALDILAYNFQAQSLIYLNDGTGKFSQQGSFAAAVGPSDKIALGDIDGDSDLDLVAAHETGESIIFLNNGQGGFTPARTLRAGLHPVLIDNDGDGDLDLILIHPDTPQALQSHLYLYRNDGAGNFTGAQLNLGGSKGFDNKFAVGDINGDGDLDYVISSVAKTNCTAASCEDLRLMLNRGLLGFVAVRLDDAGANTLALVDLDNDGDLDIVSNGLAFDTKRANDRQNKVYLNNGVNELLATASFVGQDVGPAQVTARAITAADLDGDGLIDLIVGNDGANAIYQNRNLLFDNCQQDLLMLSPQLVADVNGDGYPDIVQQNGILLINNGKGVFAARTALGLDFTAGSHLAAADLNGDGLLDLVAANSERPAAIYLQASNGQFTKAAVLDNASYPATSLAIGDLNSDGKLDILLGLGTPPGNASSSPAPNRIYFNDGAARFPTVKLLDSVGDDTQDVALGDLDSDGALDIIVANAQETKGQEQGKQNLLYFNDGSGNFAQKRPLGSGIDRTRSVVVGDLNGDGALDIVVGNYGQINVAYYNDGNGHFSQSQPLGQFLDNTTKILLIDLDHDRDLDIISANEQQSDAVYLNDGFGHFIAGAAFNEPFADARLATIGAADFDRDGDLDLIAFPQRLSLVPYIAGCMMKGHLMEPFPAAGRLPQIIVRQPGNTLGAGLYASPTLFAQRAIPIPYTLFDPEGKPVDIRAYYSPDGGGQWLPALPTSNTATRGLATLNGTNPAAYTFNWDVYASNFLGQSDNVLFRIEVQPNPRPRRHRSPDAYRRPYAAGQTYPFRVRGTQVRVVNEKGSPVAGAVLYRLPANATGRADLFPVRNAIALRTNGAGYLAGRGTLNIGDQLVALAAITATHAFTLYNTSATPTETGLNAFTVTAAGVQTLTVSAAHPLILFNLDLSLEWDARNDGTFLADLTNAIQNASDTLFDVSDGQIALGDVNVYQAKENWINADVAMYASNSVHPSASMGGVVMTPTNEIGLSGVIPSAYLPGQVRIGPLWDPFGQSEAELRQDWWLAFAHELSHYLLFLPDNYLGIKDGFLVKIDCQGSFMTSTYEEPYREFLTRDRWDAQEACRTQSVAARTTNRADWETIQRFLPWLQVPASGAAVNPGPARMPLNVTQFHFVDPSGSPTARVLPARNFDLRDAASGVVTPLAQAAAYLFKTQNTPQVEDDAVIALGSTGASSDRIKVRGAAVGDRLCVFAGASTPPRLGCAPITDNSTSLRLQPAPGWQPDIVVSPVSSRTLSITVTQAVSPGVELRVQLLPAYGTAGQAPLVAPWVVLQPDNPVNPQRFTQVITVNAPTFEGFVRVWVVGDASGREAMSQYFLSPAWGPNNRRGFGANMQAWGPDNRRGFGANQAWGANNRMLGAPFASGDGKVTIFELDNLLGDPGEASLQALPNLRNLPVWLTNVGAGYRLVANTDLAQTAARTIMFQYLEHDVTKGYEQNLTVYYLADGAQTWQRLPTYLDTNENLATARIPQNEVQGQGVYALMETVEMPALQPGWNLFAYTVPGARETALALASLDGAYTSVYAHDPASVTPWQLYDTTVTKQHPAFAGLVNDLSALGFGHAYWLYATQAITPYLGVAGASPTHTVTAAALADAAEIPPATFYGPLDPGDIMSPTPGLMLTALINGTSCGQGQVAALNGHWVYKLQVAAAVQNNNCGVIGAPVNLFIGSQAAAETLIWDNRQAQYQPLTLDASSPTRLASPAPYQIFLPLIGK